MIFSDMLQDLIHFSEGFFVASAEGNAARVAELCAWVEGLEQDPHEADNPSYLSLEEAKELVQHMRASGVL